MHSDMGVFAKGMRGSIRLLANSSSLNGFLPADLSSFLATHGQCNIELEEYGSDDIILAVSDGLADIGVVASDIETGLLQVFPYAVDELILAVSHQHPLASLSELRFEDALDHEFVCMNRASSNYQFMVRTCNKIGKHLNVRIQANSFATVLHLVRDNVGIALVPRRVMEANLPANSCVAVKLSNEWAVRKLKIVTQDVMKSPPLVRMLIDHLLRADDI
jgi:DNA-binding transcriptional LysR family regulator